MYVLKQCFSVPFTLLFVLSFVLYELPQKMHLLVDDFNCGIGIEEFVSSGGRLRREFLESLT